MSSPEPPEPPVSSVSSAVVRPAPAWLGGLALSLLTAGTAYLLSYLLLDLAWQRPLGSWNYLVGAGLMVAVAVPLRLWHPDPRPAGGTAAGGSASGGSTAGGTAVG